MNRLSGIATCLLAFPFAALAATRPYDTGDFDAVSVAAGVDLEITVGASRSIVAESLTGDFDDLRIVVQGNVLKIDRPPRGWFQVWRSSYKVRVVTPALHSLVATSGSDVEVSGTSEGDFSIEASSGSDVHASGIKAGNVKAHASSGSDLDIAGTCEALELDVSSGSDVDAGTLRCETVALRASSGSDVSVYASRSVTGSASSGSDVRIGGAPPVVQVQKSSGADVSTGK
jgi:hypothetical protein